MYWFFKQTKHGKSHYFACHQKNVNESSALTPRGMFLHNTLFILLSQNSTFSRRYYFVLNYLYISTYLPKCNYFSQRNCREHCEFILCPPVYLKKVQSR